MYRNRFRPDKSSLIISFLFMIVLFASLYFIVGGIWTILKYVSPVLIILALVFDYQTVINYGKWLIGMTQRSPLMGIAAILLSVILYPFVFAYLLTRAFLKRRYKGMVKEYERQRQGELIDYEEVHERPLDLNEPPPPRQRARPQRPPRSEYDDLFE